MEAILTFNDMYVCVVFARMYFYSWYNNNKCQISKSHCFSFASLMECIKRSIHPSIGLVACEICKDTHVGPVANIK